MGDLSTSHTKLKHFLLLFCKCIFFFLFLLRIILFILLNIIVFMKKIEVHLGSVVSIPISFSGILSFHYVDLECYDFDVEFDGLIKTHVLIPGDPYDPHGVFPLCLTPVLKVDFRKGLQPYCFTYINLTYEKKKNETEV